MTKKILILVLTVLLAASLVSCSHRKRGPFFSPLGITTSLASIVVGQTTTFSIDVPNPTVTTDTNITFTQYAFYWTCDPSTGTFAGQTDKHVDDPLGATDVDKHRQEMHVETNTVKWAASAPGKYTITVTILDSKGRWSQAFLMLEVGGEAAHETTDLEAQFISTPPDDLFWMNSNWVTTTADAAHGSTAQTYTDEYNNAGSKAGFSSQVTLRAAYTATDLYIWVQWADPSSTNDAVRRRWYFNGGTAAAVPAFPTAVTSHTTAVTDNVPVNWSLNLNDDKVAIMWDVVEGGAGASGAGGTFAANGCAMTCHTTGNMYPDTGTTDLWNWKAGESNPLGLAEDEYCRADAVTPANSGRQVDAVLQMLAPNLKTPGDLTSGPAWVWDPSKTQTLTLWDRTKATTIDNLLYLLDADKMAIEGDAVAGNAVYTTSCASCHGADGTTVSAANLPFDGLTKTAAAIAAAATDPNHGGTSGPGKTAWDALTTTQQNDVIARIRAFAGVPGYTLKLPTDAPDGLYIVNHAQTFGASNTYTVVFRRKLLTSLTTEQVQFSDTSATASYPLSVAIMDFDAKNHAGTPLIKLVFKGS
jgi:mono/diheme cytochrome c family protein